MSGHGELMAAEMREQPAVLARLVKRFEDDVARVRAAVPHPLAGVVFVARGSSDNAAVYGRYLAELAAGRPAGLAAPSVHTLYGAPIDASGYLAVALSQSGETPEIVTVCERLHAAGARTVGILNDANAPLASAVDALLTLDAGPERAVPATKTVTAQLLAAAAVAAALGPVPFSDGDLASLPDAVTAVLDDPAPAQRLAAAWVGTAQLVVTARGLLYPAALEAALKIKETAGVLAEGLSAADLRHGPLAAVDREVSVLALDGGGPPSADLRELAAVLRDRGARVAVCGAQAGDELPLPAQLPEALAVVTATVRAQQLALALAGARGRDADAPPGLSKVTATE
jgi:glutamine---fructose-6-phosphate transaminase (isomerizing)